MITIRRAAFLALLSTLSCSAGGGDLRGDDGLGSTAGGRTGAGGAATAGQTPLPCDVANVFSNHCWECHGQTPLYGAPMSLTTLESVYQDAVLEHGASVAQRIGERIHSPDRRMPPTTREALTPEELAVIDSWLAMGAPASTGASCAGDPPIDPGVTGGAGGSWNAGGTGNTAAGGSPVVNPEPVDGSCTPYRFTARQSAAGDKFHVPARPEVYQCFYFTVPWDQPVQGFSFHPVLDNVQVLHHWLLYKVDAPQPDGANVECLGTHPDSELIAGWAPGAVPYNLPPEAGLELPPPGSTMMVEIHYFNATSDPNQFDQSGVEICASPNFRPNTATVSWLGTEAIILPPGAEVPVSSVCDPVATEPIHILRSWPHMHTYGVAFNATINRADGTPETLIDVPNYSFYDQIAYDTPTVIHPGDTITSTCVFRNTSSGIVTFGESTQQEMCYNFVWAYPARSLVAGGLLHRNQCL